MGLADGSGGWVEGADAGVAGVQPVAVLAGGHRRWVWDVAFSGPDGRWLYTAGSDYKALCWDLGRRQVVQEFVGHQKACVALAVAEVGGDV